MVDDIGGGCESRDGSINVEESSPMESTLYYLGPPSGEFPIWKCVFSSGSTYNDAYAICADY